MNHSEHAALHTRQLVYIALFAAIKVVLGLMPDLGANRFAPGNAAVIMAGLWLGPVSGGLCGLIADLVGYLVKNSGYALNPIITLAAAFWGIIPGLACARLKAPASRTHKGVLICAHIVAAALVCTVCLTTLGLVLVNGYHLYAILPGRLIQAATMTPFYCVICCLLYFSPLTGIITNPSP